MTSNVSPKNQRSAVRTETHRIVNVPAEGSSTVRVVRAHDADTGADVIILAHGFGGDGRPFTRPDYLGPPIRIPTSSLPELRKALEILAEEGP